MAELIASDPVITARLLRFANSAFFGLSREVDTVIVDGKILMRHKEILFVDEDALLDEARQACEKLFKRAGVVVD